MHSLQPRRIPRRLFDLAAGFVAARTAHAVIAHCPAARRLAQKPLGRRKGLYTIPHGNYCSRYGKAMSSKAAKLSLEIPPESFVYLLFGRILRSAGVPRVVRAFTGNAVLIVAGECADPRLAAVLHDLARIDSRVRLWLGHVEDEKIPPLFSAAQVVVSPLSDDGLASASIMLALSFGRPVIGPGTDCIRETVPPGGGILYDSRQPDALGAAIRRIRHIDISAMGRRCREAAESCTWDRVARETLRVYRRRC